MGPPAPSFDYYAELGVSKSATTQEITAAYKRLARLHHPDKNPTDQETATTKFQRVSSSSSCRCDCIPPLPIYCLSQFNL